MWSLSATQAKPLLSTYYTQDLVLGAGNTVWARQSSCLWGADILMGGDR